MNSPTNSADKSREHLPNGWEIWKLAHAYSYIGSGATPATGNSDYYDPEFGVPWVTTSELRENVIKYTKQNVTGLALSEYSALRLYPAGSLLIAMYAGANIGKLAMLGVEAACNQACCVFVESPIVLNRYLFYWLWHQRDDLAALAVGGAQSNLSRADLRQERLYCPPLDVQEKIINFLDRRAAQVESLIAKKKRLLELLAEKRRALIAQAITEVSSEHQKVWKLSHAYSYIGSGTTPRSENNDYYDSEHGLAWVTTSELRENVILSTKQGVTNLALREYPVLRKYPAGSLLIAMYGATIGRLGLLGIEATCNQACCVFTASPVVNNKYLFYWFLHRKDELISLSVGGGQPNLNQAELRRERIPCPPLEIQESIATFLDEQVAKIDEAASKIHQSIRYLQEYRAALITAAVTGQIEVV